jgi:SulP family sulfate permease
VDVREPREFRQGHIAEARSVPLATILSRDIELPKDRQIVLVCRSGRRSRRAAAALKNNDYHNVIIMEGGMQAWEADGLLQAVGEFTSPDHKPTNGQQMPTIELPVRE